MATKGFAIGYTPLSTLAAYQGVVEYQENGWGVTTRYLPINLVIDLGAVVNVFPNQKSWPNAPSRQQVLVALDQLKAYIVQGPWPPDMGLGY